MEQDHNWEGKTTHTYYFCCIFVDALLYFVFIVISFTIFGDLGMIEEWSGRHSSFTLKN